MESIDEETNTTNVIVANQTPETNMTPVVDLDRYVGIVNGYVVPALAILVLITNAVVVAVFKRQKTYGASQAGLVGVAVSDTMTMLFPAPFYFYQYALGYKLGCGILEMATWISLYLPTISHTASIWLTMVLAGQRYLFVCHPFKARAWCTLRNATIIIVFTYIMSILVHLSRFFVMEKYFNGENCVLVYRKEIQANIYLVTYLIIRAIFIQFVPCVCLIVFNTIMLCGLRTVTNRKVEMHNNSETNAAAVKENTRVTIMIVAMAAITLLVELPGGIIISLHVANYYLGYEIVNYENLRSSEIIVNLFIIFSYPFNFLLYCSMSAEFKQTLGEMFSAVRCKFCRNRNTQWKEYRSRKSQTNGTVLDETIMLTATKV